MESVLALDGQHQSGISITPSLTSLEDVPRRGTLGHQTGRCWFRFNR